MGYLVIVRPDTDLTEEMVEEFKATVLERKSCPTRLEDGDIWVGGSYSLSGHLVAPYVERMIRWFRKVKNIRLSADWSGN